MAAIITNFKEFLKGAVKELVSLVNRDVKKKAKRVEKQAKKIVFNAVYNSPEMSALRRGQLSFDLGIPAGEDPSVIIAQAVSDSIRIDPPNFRSAGNRINGNFKIQIQPSSFANLLSSSFGTVVTEKGQALPWLSWLLVEGDAIIIADWHVQYGPYGRSGGARMVPNGMFTIDPQYSGTINDNFVTRALDTIGDDIVKLLGE